MASSPARSAGLERLAATPVTERTARRWLELACRREQLDRQRASSLAAPLCGPVHVGADALASATLEAVGVVPGRNEPHLRRGAARSSEPESDDAVRPGPSRRLA